jgi:Zn-finger nucleic acid-binding protein
MGERQTSKGVAGRPMPDSGPRYPCPVCLGVKMAKLQPSPDAALTLDYCQRCGGVWFDEGEVPLLRKCHPRAFAATVVLKPDVHRMRCHGCGAALERNDPRCAACGWRNVLECPVCGGALNPVERDGRRLDVCRTCRGAWFDNVELAAIWNDEVTAIARRPGALPAPNYGADHFLLGAVLWGPDLVWHGALALDALGHAGPAVADLGGIAGAAVEGTGSLAGSVFGAIADIISGLDFF